MSNVVNAFVLLKDVRYSDDNDDRVYIHCLFINRTTDDILSVDRVISIVDRRRLEFDATLIKPISIVSVRNDTV